VLGSLKNGLFETPRCAFLLKFEIRWLFKFSIKNRALDAPVDSNHESYKMNVGLAGIIRVARYLSVAINCRTTSNQSVSANLTASRNASVASNPTSFILREIPFSLNLAPEVSGFYVVLRYIYECPDAINCCALRNLHAFIVY